MTPRRLCSMILVAAVPLAVSLSTACNQFYDLDETRLIEDNKLSCDCECAPTTAEPVVSLRVFESSDDAEQVGVVMTLRDGTLHLGQGQVGLRYANLKLPPRATILSATVRFNANGTDAVATSLAISAEQSSFPATFAETDDDLGGRTFGNDITWTPAAWDAGQSETDQTTPDLKSLLQPLVERPDWTDSSSLVLRFAGTGLRRATSQDALPMRAPLLEIRYTTAVLATLPICASDGVEREHGMITARSQAAECARLETTLEGLAGPCGHPSACTCAPNTVVGTSDSGACVAPCDEVLVDAACTNFDPNAFQRCLQQGGTLATCKQHVEATNAAGGTPVCVPGSALSFHAFGSRSLCEVTGTAHIRAGDREPEHDPETTGIVELLGKPCPAGGCSVHPYFDLTMEPITFSVKWSADPTFIDLSATGRGLEAAVYAGGEISYAAGGVTGSGNGRRVLDFLTHDSNLAFDARNSDPLDFGIDWTARLCDMVGSVSGLVGEDGTCSGDGTTPCRVDSPDCDAVGGPCVLPPEAEQMDVTVSLAGEIVNQPPAADAGPDRSVECTSTAGASFLLDGRASTDPDQNLALASWREGSRVGPLVASGFAAEGALGLGDSQTYVLRVIDAHGQTDEDATEVSVVDTTPPTIFCNAPPTIRPPDAPIAFHATATDVCDVAATVVSYDCFMLTKKGKRVSKLESCVVSFAGDTVSIADSGGYGDHIEWVVEAQDESGNVGRTTCGVIVAK